MKHRVLISPADSKLIEKLKKLSVECILSQPVEGFRKNEMYHSDMQMLRLRDDVFVFDSVYGEYKDFLDKFNVHLCCTPDGKYPNNISLNVALMGNKLFCKNSSLDTSVQDFCIKNEIEIINVNQGYTKCSSLILNDRALITADLGISQKAAENGVEVLLISSGNIELEDANYGFIGGASGVIGDKVYFFGDVLTHPDGEMIIDFIKKQDMTHLSLSDGKLNDIGGFVLLS